jgi:hypothetical protein
MYDAALLSHATRSRVQTHLVNGSISLASTASRSQPSGCKALNGHSLTMASNLCQDPCGINCISASEFCRIWEPAAFGLAAIG